MADAKNKAVFFDLWATGYGECELEREESPKGEYVRAEDYNNLYDDYASLRASHSELLKVMERYLRTHHITEKAGDDFRAAIAKAERL